MKFFVVYGDDTFVGENIESVLESFFEIDKQEILRDGDWEERSPDDYIALRNEESGSLLFEGRLIDAYHFMKDKLPPPPCYFCSYLS